MDKSFRYGNGLQAERLFVSTPATIYHSPEEINKSAVYATAEGSIWTDIVTTSLEQHQRPALYRFHNYSKHYNFI